MRDELLKIEVLGAILKREKAAVDVRKQLFQALQYAFTLHNIFIIPLNIP